MKKRSSKIRRPKRQIKLKQTRKLSKIKKAKTKKPLKMKNLITIRLVGVKKNNKTLLLKAKKIIKKKR